MKNSKATDTLKFLAIHNSWRRGDETSEMQNPTDIGAAIDDAIDLLSKYDELETEIHEQCVLNGKGAEREAALLGKVERLEKDNAILKKKYNILFRHMTDANVQMHKAITDALEVGGENILTF
jgi:hypothetical protein